jgi:hypothetical protein
LIGEYISVDIVRYIGRWHIMGEEKRTAGILGSRATISTLVNKFAGDDGIVRCISCGREDITWHHVVPIEVGGADVISNIVPVCNDCHMNIHVQKSLPERLLSGRARTGKFGGRKRSMPENYKELLNDYVYCRIGKKELSARWGVTVTSRKDPTKKIPVDMVRLTGKSWYKDYLRELGIKKVENHVDYLDNLRNARTYIREGEYVGTITYLDGREEKLYRHLKVAQ